MGLGRAEGPPGVRRGVGSTIEPSATPASELIVSVAMGGPSSASGEQARRTKSAKERRLKVLVLV